VGKLEALFRGLELAGREAEIARDIVAELKSRLAFLDQVGPPTFARPLGADASGGEAQRIRLASQLARTCAACVTSWTSHHPDCTGATTGSCSTRWSSSRRKATAGRGRARRRHHPARFARDRLGPGAGKQGVA